jgi:hypothetical protein
LSMVSPPEVAVRSTGWRRYFPYYGRPDPRR